MEAAGGDGPEQGGRSSQPGAGQGGTPAAPEGGVGGEPAAPVGGHGGATQGGAGGVAEGGAGGAGGVDCPLLPGAFSYSCGEVSELWAPVYGTADKTFHLDVSSLPFPIASGTVSYFFNVDAAESCGIAPVVVAGDDVSAVVDTSMNETAVRIVDFTLTDVCGSTHRYDPIGAPQCNDLQGSGPAGTWDLECAIRFGACPDLCE
jgi:hypothetical protein